MATNLERLTVLIEANTRQYARSMEKMQADTARAIRGSSKSIQSLDKALASATATARTFASVFGAGILTGGLAQLPGAIKGLVKEVADLGDQADRIGITAERLQELNFQAEQTGSSAETMAEGLQKFAQNLAEARTGSGELYKLLVQNGLALDDIAKMSVNDALKVFVDLLGNASDEADKLKIATIGLGRGGADLALTFAGGSQGLLEFALQARAASAVISNDLVKSAQDIDDEFSQLTSTISTMIKAGLLEFIETTKREIIGLQGVLEDMRTSAEQNARSAGQRAGKLIAGGTPKTSDVANDRISQAFEAAGVDEAKNRLRRTRLPPPSGGGGAAAIHHAAARAIGEHRDAAAELIKELERELSLIGKSETEQKISNALRQAGAEATAAQKERISELVPQIEAQQKAYDDLIDTLDTVRDAAGGALDAFAQSIQAGEGPVKALKASLLDLLQTIIRIGEQRAILALFGMGGTAGGGFFGSAVQKVAVHVTASPLFHATVEKGARQAEERAVARGPAVARSNNLRYATP
jgi:hypothetical protein